MCVWNFRDDVAYKLRLENYAPTFVSERTSFLLDICSDDPLAPEACYPFDISIFLVIVLS